jgi:hypothetical protein
MDWTNRLINLLRGRRLTAEIDEELALHAESRLRDNLAIGMTLQEAQQDAARRFGGRMQMSEATPDADIFVWIDSLAPGHTSMPIIQELPDEAQSHLCTAR